MTCRDATGSPPRWGSCRLPVVTFVTLLLTSVPVPVKAQDPQPKVGPDASAADPAAQLEASIAKSFAELADSDADVRESARAALLAIERRQLPVLKQVVARARPLLPSQAAVLRGIVTHVYLSGEPYDAEPDLGFLGVRMQPTAVNLQQLQRAAGERGEFDFDPDAVVEPGEPPPPPPVPIPDVGERFGLPRMGVVIVERIPGFVGARLLRDGDVIVGLADRPGLQFTTAADFTEAVRNTRPGRPVHLLLLRRARLMKVSVPLDHRPTAAGHINNGPMDELDRFRRGKAEAYWRDAFAPMLAEGVG